MKAISFSLFAAFSLWLTSCTPTTTTPYSPTGTSNVVSTVVTNVLYQSAYVTSFGPAGWGGAPTLNSVVVVPGSPKDVYVSDSGGNKIHYLTFDGATLSKVGSVASTAPFFMQANAAGNKLYVMESTPRLTIWTIPGLPVTVAPSPLTFSNGAGPGYANATVGCPLIDGNGNLWIADRGNNRFECFTNLPAVTGNVFSNFFGYISAASLATGFTTFSGPFSLRLNYDGNLMLVDTAFNRVVLMSTNFTLIKQFANPSTAASSTVGQFNTLADITTNVYGHYLVSDAGNHRIQRMDTNWNSLEVFGSSGSAAGQFNVPRGIAMDGNGYIYICDVNNQRLQVWSTTVTTTVTTNNQTIWQ